MKSFVITFITVIVAMIRLVVSLSKGAIIVGITSAMLILSFTKTANAGTTIVSINLSIDNILCMIIAVAVGFGLRWAIKNRTTN